VPQNTIQVAVQAGIPHRLRGKVWSLMLDTDGVKGAVSLCLRAVVVGVRLARMPPPLLWQFSHGTIGALGVSIPRTA
jgi:hypothetical protein